MKLRLFETVVLAFAPLVLRTMLYLLACRLRSIRITILTATLLAGAGTLLGFVPLPIPSLLQPALAIGLAMFLMSRYTEADLYPDIVFIPLTVELLAMVAVSEVLFPLLA